jgi:hypothetical protein
MQRGVSGPSIVVSFDPEECVLADFGEIVPWSGVDDFFFVGSEERLGDCVVVTGGTPAHGAAHAVDRAEAGEFLRGVLAAAVRIKPNSV